MEAFKINTQELRLDPPKSSLKRRGLEQALKKEPLRYWVFSKPKVKKIDNAEA